MSAEPSASLAAIAVITARGGSKGLPRKNVLALGGIPLIAHTIRAAFASACFETIVVSTDDDEIAALSAREGAAVLRRPDTLASDHASSLDVLAHALAEARDFAHYALLQPTSPLRTAAHLREAFALFRSGAAETCVSVTPSEHPPQKCLVREGDRFVPLFRAADLTMPRQQLRPTYRINGALYLGHVHTFLKSQDLFAPRLVCYEMDARASLDIDTADDLRFAQLLYERVL